MSERTNTKRKRKDRDGVYTRADRPGFWISWHDHQGRRHYRKTEAQSHADAVKILALEKAKVERAAALGFTPAGEDTFAELAKRFLHYQKARLTPRAYERERGIVEGKLKDAFPGKVAAIRRSDVQGYVTKRSTDVSAHSVLKELNVIKHLLRLAVEWEIVPVNPAQGVKPPRVPAGRVRYLQPTELKHVLTICPDWIKPIVWLAATTAMRRGEILGLRWLDVDLIGGRILLPQTKNGEGRIVYLNEGAHTVLAGLRPDNAKSTDRVFKVASPEHVSVAFSRACAKAKIEDFRFHDLRHTAASWLRMRGADIHTVAQLLGHKDLKMAARYQHLSPAFLSDAVKRLDGVFEPSSYPLVTSGGEVIESQPVCS